jgi:hypothetical protein
MDKVEKKVLAYDIFKNPIHNLNYIVTNKKGKLGVYKVRGETGKDNSMLECYYVVKDEKYGYGLVNCCMVSIDKNSEMVLLNINVNEEYYDGKDEDYDSNYNSIIYDLPRSD